MVQYGTVWYGNCRANASFVQVKELEGVSFSRLWGLCGMYVLVCSSRTRHCVLVGVLASLGYGASGRRSSLQ